MLAILALAPFVLTACGSRQNTLHPESKAERSISTLWWVMMVGAWIGFAVVAFLLFLGWVRRHREGLPFGGGDRVATAFVIGLGIFVPMVVLSALFIWADLFVIRKTEAPRAASTPLTIHVVGHQWFWEIRYPGQAAVTANEIHIPVRTAVDVEATTADVIHSFWVPELNRKIDLIPGRVNRVLLDADRVGVYRGQCAEFCGLQHAHMAMAVFVDPPARFKAWLASQAKPARSPRTALERRGREVFLANACAGCHTIRGTAANGRIGPDLTHVKGRTSLAALTIPNTDASIAAWIQNPQHFKPGNKMPALGLAGPDLRAVVAYLRSLR